MLKRCWAILLMGILGQLAFSSPAGAMYMAPSWGWGCGMGCMSMGGGPFSVFYGTPFSPWGVPPYGTGQWMMRPNPMAMYYGAYPTGWYGPMGPMTRYPYAGGAIID